MPAPHSCSVWWSVGLTATPPTLQLTMQFRLQAEDDLDQQEWMEAIQGVTACLLNGDVDVEALSRAQPKPSRPTHSRQGSRAGTAPCFVPCVLLVTVVCVHGPISYTQTCIRTTVTWSPSCTHRQEPPCCKGCRPGLHNPSTMCQLPDLYCHVVLYLTFLWGGKHKSQSSQV